MSRMHTPEHGFDLFVPTHRSPPTTSSGRSSRLFAGTPKLLSRRSSRMNSGSPHTGRSSFEHRMNAANPEWRPPNTPMQRRSTRMSAEPQHRSSRGEARGHAPPLTWRQQQQMMLHTLKHKATPWEMSGSSPPPRVRAGLYGTVTRAPQPYGSAPLDLDGLSRALPATAAIPSMGPDSFMKWIVDGWDSNHDGMIDANELAAGKVQSGPLHREGGDFRV